MYEFNYPELADYSAEDVQQTLDELNAEINKVLNDPKAKLTNDQKEQIMYQLDYINRGLNVMIDVSRLGDEKIDFAVLDKILEIGKQINRPVNFCVTGSSFENQTNDKENSFYGDRNESVTMLFTQERLDDLISAHNYLVGKGENGFNFIEYDMAPDITWTFDQVINANLSIDIIVDHIKEMNLSPFEAIAFIHSYITSQFPYIEDKENPFDSRSLIGILNTEKIVCVGYSKLVKAIIDKLDMPGLQCQTFVSVLMPSGRAGDELLDGTGAGHMQDLIYIDDPKYEVKGTYVNDATWDSKNGQFQFGKGIANFMYPVADLMHYKGHDFDQPRTGNELMLKVSPVGFIVKTKNPKTLPVIKDNIKNSKPIPISKYRLVLENVYKKMGPEGDEKAIKDGVEEILKLSKHFAHQIFTEEAINSITKKAYKDYAKQTDLPRWDFQARTITPEKPKEEQPAEQPNGDPNNNSTPNGIDAKYNPNVFGVNIMDDFYSEELKKVAQNSDDYLGTEKEM